MVKALRITERKKRKRCNKIKDSLKQLNIARHLESSGLMNKTPLIKMD